MINRLAPIVVILLSVFALAGCSGIFGSTPREQADEAISDANESISEHNKLFDEARSTYADVKQKIEAGDDPSKEKDNITEAKNNLEEARTHLQDARGSLETVDDLDVDPAVKEYAGLLSEAMQDQLDAEAKEIEFYGILEAGPRPREQPRRGPGPALRSRGRLPEGRENLRRSPGPRRRPSQAYRGG